MYCPTKWHVAFASVAHVAMVASEVVYDGYQMEDHKNKSMLTVCKDFNYINTFLKYEYNFRN